MIRSKRQFVLSVVAAAAVVLFCCSAMAEDVRRFPVIVTSVVPPDVVCVFGRVGSEHAIAYGDVRGCTSGTCTAAKIPRGLPNGWVYQSLDLSTLNPPKPQDLSVDQWKFLLVDQRALLKDTHDTLAVLSKRRHTTTVCSDPDTSCNPESDDDIGAGWHTVWCARSPHARKPIAEVAFVGFNFHEPNASEPALRRIYYDGHILSADFDAQWKGQPTFSLMVLGGTYEKSEPQFGVQAGTTLDLVPRCSTRDVALPRMWRNEEGSKPAVTATLNDGTACTETLDAAGRFSMSFRTSLIDTPSTLHVAMAGAGGSWRFADSWNARIPPATPRPKTLEVSFSWTPPCTYNAIKECPTATFADVGVSCPGIFDPKANACRYDCFVAPSAKDPNVKSWPDAVALPVAVRFHTAGDLLSWTDTLIAIGQNFTSFVTPDQFTVELDASQWTDMAVGDDVAGWFVTTPDGSSRWVPRGNPERGPATTTYTVAVPKVRCTDTVAIRAVGQRRYEERSVSIHNGRINAGAPSDTGHRLAFGVEAGFVEVFPVGTSGIRGAGREMASAYPAGAFGIWTGYRPRARIWLEFDIGAWVSNRPVYTVNGTHSELYLRFPFLPTFGIQITPNIGVGFGGGYVLGRTLYQSSDQLYGGTDSASAVQLLFRFRPLLPVAADLRFTALFNESLQAYDTDFIGGVAHQTGKMYSMSVGLLLRWDVGSGTLLAVPREQEAATSDQQQAAGAQTPVPTAVR